MFYFIHIVCFYPVSSFLLSIIFRQSLSKASSDEYVKIKKKDWKYILEAYKWAKSNEKLFSQYEEKIVSKDNKISKLETLNKKCMLFLSKLGLEEKFEEFISPKSVKNELRKKHEHIENQKKGKAFDKEEQQYKKTQMEI